MTIAYQHSDGYFYTGPEPVTIDPPVVPSVEAALGNALAVRAGDFPPDVIAETLEALAADHWKLVYDMPPVPMLIHPPECNADGTEVDSNGSWLVCPFCGDTDGLRYQDSYCYERWVDKNEGNADGTRGTFIVSGFESTDDPGDSTPGLCCIDCAIDVSLATPDGWEMDYS